MDVVEHDDEKFLHQHLAGQISHEENLINNRLTWMLTFQGFLFASLALMTNNQTSLESLRRWLLCVIPFTGALVAFVTFLGICAAYRSIDKHKKECEPLIKHYPMPGGGKCASKLGRFTSKSIPWILIVAWISWILV